MNDEVRELLEQRKGIEEKIEEYHGILKSQGVDMNTPLLDAEGFPRADIDLYQIRHARHNIICLGNDHVEVMKKLEQALHDIHAQSCEARSAESAGVAGGSSTRERVERKPKPAVKEYSIGNAFLKVNDVAANSPAAEAGLQAGDLVFQFGTLTENSFKQLTDVATVVQHAENEILAVGVLRDGSPLSINLRPHKWSGRGLLGCHLVQASS
eukprot:Clim_evm31s47 gene=Clim_evmTU31s47